MLPASETKDDLALIVQDLIETKREGDYWDFKLKHHENAGDLIKDIICLANTVKHKGDRYLIFGVDNNFGIAGVATDNRRTQTDILKTLSDAGFAGHLYPDVYLRELAIGNIVLDVLVVKDTNEKPFYLQSEYSKRGVNLHAGTIYSRVRDMNTPSDHVAPAADIEKMWRERFGLDLTPLERLKKYLLDFTNWTTIGEKYWYYTSFPEFTIEEADTMEPIEGGDSWVRGATNPSAYFTTFHCKYYQSTLWKEEVVYYDEMRGRIPNPDTRIIEDAEEPRHFYSFDMDDFKFLLLQFYTKQSADHFTDENPFRIRSCSIPIVVFQNKIDRINFCNHLSRNMDILIATAPDSVFDLMRFESGRRENDIDVLKFSSQVKRCYDEWKISQRQNRV